MPANLKRLFAFALCSLAAFQLRAQSSPSFLSPDPPEPAAADLVRDYVDALAAEDFDRALARVDQRGMRQYLLERRLAELKTRNPELTPKDLDDLSAKLQVVDLEPARLRNILLEVMAGGGFKGISWQIRGYAPSPDGSGYLASVEALTPQRQEKPILLGLVKLGDQWMVSPAIVERMMESRPVVRLAQDSPPPPEIVRLADDFWSPFRDGQMDAAYAVLSQPYRSRVPLLAFLGQAQNFLSKAGVPLSWEIVKSVETEPGTLAAGVAVKGSSASRPTLMVFRKLGQTWTLHDVLLEMPDLPAPTAPPAPDPASVSRPDLRPDLRPAPPPSSPAMEPPAQPAPPSGRAQPIGPLGPDLPASP